MTSKGHSQKELKDFLDRINNLNEKHDSVYKERELELKGYLLNRLIYRQEPFYLI